MIGFARVRGRYLAAMGLASLPAIVLACKDASQPVGVPLDDGSTTTSTSTSTPTSTSTSTSTSTPTSTSTSTSTSTVQAPRLPYNMPACPSGKFCVAEPAKAPVRDAGAPPPYAKCEATTTHPGDPPADSGMYIYRNVSFDKDGTDAARGSDPKACCYSWYTPCPGGRALRVDDDVLVAPTEPRIDWCAAIGAVDVAGLSAETRAAIAMHWVREASFEHASVASFARATLDLMAVGAPPALLAEAQAAAMDEIDHARMTFALARAYGGADVGPGALPGSALATGARTLAEVARDTFVDACAGESIAALAVREAARRADDPVVRGLLERIADDEERHAALAWKTVAWALRTGGDDVRRALAAAAASVRADACARSLAEKNDLARHGILSVAEQRALRARALAEVVLPCVDALLGLRASTPRSHVADA